MDSNDKKSKRLNGDSNTDKSYQGLTGQDSDTTKSTNTQNIQNSKQSSQSSLEDLTAHVAELNSIKENMNSFNIPKDEQLFYERKVKPLVQNIYFLSLSSSSIANTAQLMQNNTYGRKREIRHALDLTYEMNKEIEELFKVLRKRSCIFREGINIAIDGGENSLEYYKKNKEE